MSMARTGQDFRAASLSATGGPGAEGSGVESRRASLRLACQDNALGLSFHLHRVEINLGIANKFGFSDNRSGPGN